MTTTPTSPSLIAMVELDVLLDLARWTWNRHRGNTIALADNLRDHGLNAETTPVNRYPSSAACYYGELNATRSHLSDLFAVIIGTGTMEDYKRAWGLIDRWMEKKLPPDAVVSELAELYDLKHATKPNSR